MNDDMDTDAYCKTNVHTYSMTMKTLQHLREKYDVLDLALDKHERILVDVKRREPAIDYIIQDQFSQRHYQINPRTQNMVHNFEEDNRRRKLTVKLKNAILVVWQDVKKGRNIQSMDDVIKSLSEKVKQQNDPNYIEKLK